MQHPQPAVVEQLEKVLIDLFLEKDKHVYKRVKTGAYGTSLLTNASFVINGVRIHLRSMNLSPDEHMKDTRFNLAPHPARVQGNFISFNITFGFGDLCEPKQYVVPSLLYLSEGEWSLYVPDDVRAECSKYLVPVANGESFRSKVINELGIINKDSTDQFILDHIRKMKAEIEHLETRNENITGVLLDTVNLLEKAAANINICSPSLTTPLTHV